VTFTGRADQKMIAEYLSTAHLGLSPDLKTPLNDVSTHNKTMEYMAFALPVVSFDLVESRLSAGDSSVYVESGDVAAFAKAIDELLDDPDRRVEMSRTARARCVSELDWEPQARRYVQVFDKICGRTPEQDAAPAMADRRAQGTKRLPEVAGRTVIDLRDAADFDSFLRLRGLADVVSDTEISGLADVVSDIEIRELVEANPEAGPDSDPDADRLQQFTP
jgi:hypothetical protein